MFVLAAFSAAAADAAPRPGAASHVTVRIERAVRISRESWERLPPSSRTERRMIDEHGRQILLRTLDLP